ncbi:hypothetical protein [Roseomonas sp. BN140053]|uniref:hypothetical protein n=1 Tax=Roseomonas sp. BN140053 TaxID=3391898 RepID=UPI0039E78FEB
MSILTENFIQSVRAMPSPADQMAMLHGRAKGRRCFLLACGPSLAEYSSMDLGRMLRGELVIAIKQAFDYVPEACDFLLLNTWNYQSYNFARRRPLIIREAADADPPVFGETDVLLHVPAPNDLSAQLTRSKRFDDYTFDRTLTRPWGPGVLYEIGFFLALHLGVKEIVTLGWDVGVRNSAIMPHFYDKPDPRKTRILAEAARMPSVAQRNRFLHENGVLYNKPRIIPEEVDACADVSGDWYRWLNGKGVPLSIVSHQSAAAPEIPRVRLEQLGLGAAPALQLAGS